MAKILVTPIASSGIAPFEEDGELYCKQFTDSLFVYYINGSSYPAEIVTILEE